MLEIKYVYIIVIIIIALILPGIITVLLFLGLSLSALIYVAFKLISKQEEKSDVKNNSNNSIKNGGNSNSINKMHDNRFWNDVNNPNDRRNALDKCNSMTGDEDIDSNLLLLNSMYPTNANEKTVDNYYSSLPYEEQFADYGLSKAQKNLLNHNDVANENASNYNYTKFAKYWGDEMEIKYEDAWYGVDT